MNPEAGIAKYFQGLVDVQDKLKSTNEPQSDTTIKRHAKAQMKKLPNMQLAVNKWDKKEDPTGVVSFMKFRNYFIKEDRINH